ncbi:uncharacterized protein DUF4188 [Kineococcus xinjiangensis]|uniref:Uncharacterized protein DUF4188 n=2 Tax=Kineococcus xinjiangensis TaxID=512762 RepID=A0A2S6IW30_9ACTN|nr:uncharacterized protein DUF4188 [Kineococcus xinjiangensis]
MSARPVPTTHDHDGDLVVFLIGMRINRPLRIGAWLPVLRAMPPMLQELARRPELGMLHATSALGPGGPLVVQYWRDLASLQAYAHAEGGLHRAAWREFNARARRAGDAVGIWHETLVVPAGHHESVYVAAPGLGLAAAFGAVPVGRGRERAAQRLRVAS